MNMGDQRVRSGARRAFGSQSRGENETVQQELLEQGKGCELGLGPGCLYKFGSLEGLTKATIVIVFAWDNTALLFFQSQEAGTSMDTYFEKLF